MTTNPEGQFTSAFVGYGPEATDTVVELTFNRGGDDSYDLGTGFDHLALGVRDIHAVCAGLERQGAPAPRKPGPMKHGATHIAFIEDPDGYRIEPIDLDTM